MTQVVHTFLVYELILHLVMKMACDDDGSEDPQTFEKSAHSAARAATGSPGTARAHGGQTRRSPDTPPLHCKKRTTTDHEQGYTG